jgi:hypothetical protein
VLESLALMKKMRMKKLWMVHLKLAESVCLVLSSKSSVLLNGMKAELDNARYCDRFHFVKMTRLDWAYIVRSKFWMMRRWISPRATVEEIDSG